METDLDSIDDDSDSSVGEDFFLKEFEKAKKQKIKESSGQSDHIEHNFILGSAAVVKSLWSMYDAFNTKRRRGMSPITVEMILFLKKNKDLWGIKNVARVERKIAEHEEFMQDMEVLGW
jgi:hypothetical protein